MIERYEIVTTEFARNAEAVRAELEQDFDIRLVYESNEIESTGVAFEETRRLLLEARSSSPISRISYAEGIAADPKMLDVVGHGEALRFVHDLASNLDGRPLREVDIRDLHHLTMAAEPSLAGRYKSMDNQIAGRPAHLLTARAEDVGYHMHKLTEWISGCSLHGPIPAAVVHAWMSDIHPFEDGNGRVTRLVTNYLLFKHRWPCLIIRAGADRQRYYEALNRSDLGGDIGPLLSLFIDGLDRTLSEMQDPAFSRSLVARDIKRENDFGLWSAMLRSFSSALSQKLKSRWLSFDLVGSISPSDFAWLQRFNPAGNSWWAKIRSLDDHLDILTWVGYQSPELRSIEPGLKPAPSLFFSERNHSPKWLHPYRPLWHDDRIDIHEVSLQVGEQSGRVVVRTGDTVQRLSAPMAAELVATALTRFKEHLY